MLSQLTGSFPITKKAQVAHQEDSLIILSDDDQPTSSGEHESHEPTPEPLEQKSYHPSLLTNKRMGTMVPEQAGNCNKVTLDSSSRQNSQADSNKSSRWDNLTSPNMKDMLFSFLVEAQTAFQAPGSHPTLFEYDSRKPLKLAQAQVRSEKIQVGKKPQPPKPQNPNI